MVHSKWYAVVCSLIAYLIRLLSQTFTIKNFDCFAHDWISNFYLPMDLRTWGLRYQPFEWFFQMGRLYDQRLHETLGKSNSIFVGSLIGNLLYIKPILFSKKKQFSNRINKSLSLNLFEKNWTKSKIKQKSKVNYWMDWDLNYGVFNCNRKNSSGGYLMATVLAFTLSVTVKSCICDWIVIGNSPFYARL